jgi:hypothetical protein
VGIPAVVSDGPLAPLRTQYVLAEVAAERKRQNMAWGVQDHPDGTGPETFWQLDDDEQAVDAERIYRQITKAKAEKGTLTWKDILLEEVAESFAENDPAKLRAELVQAAAVAVAWIEKIDRHEQARRHVTHNIRQDARTLYEEDPLTGGRLPTGRIVIIYCTECPLYVERPADQADVGAAIKQWEASS